MAELAKVVHPFAPIYDENSRVLILGSFPSVISRQQSFYYANPHNRFWPVLFSLFEEDPCDRTDFCHRHHIALWDVIQSCTIAGSSDASIKDVVVNDIGSIVNKTNVKAIFTTGSRASSLYDKYIQVELPHISLPSTSSANARMKMEDLCRKYEIIKEYINEED
ncbi:MAG: DNA-deoxyinosine glycosylase [Lactimicrobium sp.]|jgi:TDG/mug DNA glycosylase family protein|uniref:DNA-deoxyinosine glycosylase n=1 Tax=Lactimicrobium sp. TaxID=2563780 RepID=UPI002F358D51